MYSKRELIEFFDCPRSIFNSRALLWIRIGFNDPALYLNADPDPGSQTNAGADPDPG
jgi:hypothetical protein